MRHFFCLLPGLLFSSLCVLGEEFPSVDAIRSLPPEQSRVLVYGTGFDDQKDPKIKLEKGFHWAPGEGVNGNAAIRVDREGDVSQSHWAVIKLDGSVFSPGVKYTLAFQYRTKGLRRVLKGAPFILAKIECSKPNEYNRFQITEMPENEDFQPYTLDFSIPAGAKDVILAFELRQFFEGSIWFDDVEVYSSGISASVLLRQPCQSTFTDKNGRFSLTYSGPPEYDGVFAAVELERDGKAVASKVIPVSGNRIEGDFGPGLALGPAKLNVCVSNVKTGRRFLSHSFQVQVHEAVPVPPYAVMTDEHGRVIIDGKPFMPIGMFASPATTEERWNAYKTMSNAGFNLVLDYGNFYLFDPRSLLPGSPDPENILRGLDALHRETNLRVLFSLQSVCQPPQRLKRFAGVTAPDQILNILVPALSRHPALFGWYMNDEMEEFAVPRSVAFREQINSLDPHHPTVALTNQPGTLPNYARTGDHLCLDTYPLNKKAAGDDISRILRYMETGEKTGLLCWGAAQTFNWAWWRRDVSTPAEYAEYHDPNPVQIRAMNYLYAVGGARAFIMYNYPAKERYVEKAAKFGDPDWDKRARAALPEIVAPLRKAEPYIMGIGTPPEISVENHGPAEVAARAFRSDEGKVGVIIVGCGGKPGKNNADAIITLKDSPELKSQYGKTVSLGNGQYRFTSESLDSDLLTE